MNSEEHRAWNEEMGLRYNPDSFITRSGLAIRAIEAMRLKATLNALECPAGRILDLGCGPGNLLEKLSGDRIFAVDLSESLLEQARGRVRARAEIELVRADAQELPFAADFFDRVACSELLEHVLDPDRVISEIHRVCRPGAVVVFTIPNEALINATKRVVLALGMKKLVAGDYPMSDDMLDAWHLREVDPPWIARACLGRFRKRSFRAIPCRLLPYHHVAAFEAMK